MDPYLLYTDSAADMPQSAYQEFDIRIIPMDYMLNGESVTFYTERPDHDEQCDRLFEMLKQGAEVHTSQITPYRYIENWTPVLEEGHGFSGQADRGGGYAGSDGGAGDAHVYGGAEPGEGDVAG